MLEPNSRQLLRDALRPPPGYALDRAVTTTFSLDLMALLTIPVSFTFFQLKDDDGPPAVDPLALLEALRRYAGRITVFCQAGHDCASTSNAGSNCTCAPSGREPAAVDFPSVLVAGQATGARLAKSPPPPPAASKG